MVATHWADGGAGAEALARAVVDVIDRVPADFRLRLRRRRHAVGEDATRSRRGSTARPKSPPTARSARRSGSCRPRATAHYPVCVAKTQYSFSTDPLLHGAPSGHVVNIREVRLAAGAEFVVMVCGDVMTMPGLPKEPSAAKIDLADDGRVVGLF